MKPPQQLSSEAIKDFKAIYKDEFGEELTDDQVQEMALRLLRLFHIFENSELREHEAVGLSTRWRIF